MVAGAVMLISQLMLAEMRIRDESLLVRRNFYGVLRIRDDFGDEELARRHLVHGTISHGYQYLGEDYRDLPASYYSANSGAGRALAALQSQGPVRFGVIGLGVGVLSTYAREQDYLRIYEIDPDVVGLAEEFFTFLPKARQTGADLEVLLGDARLTLERQQRQQFDLLVVDAFSSDAIPTHLLTHEAFKLYVEHLKPNGVLAVHISNRFVDLGPVCLRASEQVNRSARVLRSSGDSLTDASVWVLITANDALFEQPQFQGADVQFATADATFMGWTDQYSSLWPVLKFGGVAVPPPADAT